MISSGHGHIDCVRALLEAGADKTIISTVGHTARDLANGTSADEIRALLDAA
jgi:ankyrin repeat protein